MFGKKVNKGYLTVEGTSQEVASAVINLQESKAELEEMRNACKGNKYEIIKIDIAIGKISECLLKLGVNSDKFTSLEVCNLITEVGEFLNAELENNTIGADTVESYNEILAKEIRRTEEDRLRNRAIDDVTSMVDGLSKEELQKLIERINNNY